MSGEQVKSANRFNDIVVCVVPEPEGDAIASSSSNLYVDLRGKIEVLTDDASLTIGQFETAIFLLPDLSSIADGFARLREGADRVEVVLLESPRLWFVRERHTSGLVGLRHINGAITGIPLTALDAAFAKAIGDFLAWLVSMRPGKGVDAGALQYLETIASVWPGVEPLVLPWRRLLDRE